MSQADQPSMGMVKEREHTTTTKKLNVNAPLAWELSYERYLALLTGRERVSAILADRRVSAESGDEEAAMDIAVREQSASRR